MEEQTFKFLNKVFILGAILVLGVLVYFTGQMAYQFISLNRQTENQISVSGEGKVFAKPDVALVSFGVTTQGRTTAEAIKDNTEKMNAIIQAVKDLGVEEKDIQSTNYNLYPQYNYTEISGRKFEGYTLDQNIQVKIRDFSKTGDVLSKATEKGANVVGSLQFTIDNPEQLRQEARAKAIEQAKENAQNLAKVSGIKLGKLINVYENYNPSPMLFKDVAIGMGGASPESAPAPTIQPGQQEINVTINLTYQVK